MTPPDRARVTTLVCVDIDTAFSVFTEEVDAWWKRGPRYRVEPERMSAMRFEPRVGGRLLEVYDDLAGDAFVHGEISVWDPPRRLVFEMGGRDFEPGQATEVEVVFEPSEGGTRVTVEHRGWDSLPEGHPAFHGLVGGAFIDMMTVWWADLLAASQAYARGR